MDWGFLGEFWNAITGVGEFTIDFFKNIGLAVAGAIGNLFEYFLHYISDFFVFLSWLFLALKEIAVSILLPISYVISFLRAFIGNAIKEPPSPEATYSFATSTMQIFQTIPYWSVFSMALGVCILVLGGIGILKLIIKL